MTKFQTYPTNIDTIDQSFEHTLFVEGKKDFDSTVLQNLLADIPINIQSLCSCKHINAAADALYDSHKKYYFIVDRDYKEIEDVEASWDNFPDENTKNLLIWRKRELENYFIEPDYLAKSKYIKSDCTIENIKEVIINTAQNILYYDVAKRIISTFKPCSNEDFQQSSDRNECFQQLVYTIKKMHENCTIPDEDELSRKFEEYLSKYTGGCENLNYDNKNWLNLISGKEIFDEVIKQCFMVKGTNNKIKQGNDAKKEIIKDLLKKNDQPNDFKQLVKIIEERIINS